MACLESEELGARLKEEAAHQEALQQEVARGAQEAEQQRNSLLAQVKTLWGQVALLESEARETEIV